MIHVHNIFVCKPGNASKLAKIFKEALTGNDDFVHHYHTVKLTR